MKKVLKLYKVSSKTIISSICIGMLQWIFTGTSIAPISAQVMYEKEDITLLGVKDGLPNEWVSEIQEDRSGFIWFGTQYGLSRYDGKEFLNFKFDPDDSTSLPLNWVLQIEEDPKGYLWVGMLKALARMDPQTFKFTPYSLGKDASNLPRIIDMIVDRQGFVWAVTNQGLFLGHADNPQFINVYSLSAYFPIKWGQGILFKKEKDLFYWEGTWPHPKPVYSMNQIPPDPDQRILFINAPDLKGMTTQNFIAGTNEVWGNRWSLDTNKEFAHYTSNNNLWRYDHRAGRHQQLIDLKEIFRSRLTPELIEWYVDRNRNTWIATSKGVILLKNRPTYFELFAQRHARDIKCTSTSIWLGGDHGLFQYNYQGVLLHQWTSLATSSFDIAGNKVIGGTLSGKILTIDLQTRQVDLILFPREGIAMHNIFYTGIRGNKVFWGGNPYLIESDLQFRSFRFVSLKDQEGQQHPDILTGYLADTNELWIGTVTGGAFVFDLTGDLTLISQYTHRPRIPGSLSSNVVFDISQDSKRKMIFGTESGLTVFDRFNNSFTRWREKDGLADEKIMAIQSDRMGQYWISTISHGLMRWISAVNQFQNFTDQAGLVSNDFLFSSAARDSSGRLLFGTDQGIIRFDPLEIPLLRTSFDSVYLSSCLINDRPFYEITRDTCRNIQYKKSLVLKHNQNRITFSLSQPTASSFIGSNTYYRLTLQDETWRPWVAGERLNYNNLSPGHYQLIIKNQTDEQELISMTVRPPWHHTPQAYVAFILATLLLMGVTIRLLIQRKLRNQRFKHEEQLIQTRSHYFSNLTHELKTPLQLIQGPIQLIKQKLEKEDDNKEILELIHLADTHSDRIAALVGQMETLQKLDQAKLKKVLTPVWINPFLKSLLHSFEYKTSKKQLSLLYDSEMDDSVFLSLDPNQLTSVVYNLIQNVYDHAQRASYIQLQVSHTEDQLFLSISDDGEGIAQEDQPYIFDRFYTKSKNNQGTGLGLALVKEVVDWLGGSVTYKNNGTRGSIFQVCLPAVKSTRPQEESVPKSYTQEIVVVEDEPNMVQFINLSFANTMKVSAFSSAHQAVEYIIQTIPDVILTDRMMPGMDGIQFSQRIKNHTLTRHIPIIMISGKSDVDSRVQAYQANIDIFLPKPFSIVELQHVITQVLDNRQKLKETYSHKLKADAQPDSFQDPFIKSLMNIIENELHLGELNIDVVCKKIAVSRTQLFRKCTALFGLSFHQLIQQKRLVRAKILLMAKPSLAVSEVATACGFNDSNYFSKFFKKETTLTPMEFRQQGSIPI